MYNVWGFEDVDFVVRLEKLGCKKNFGFFNCLHQPHKRRYGDDYFFKENYSKNCSKFMAGENNPMYGKQNKGYKHTEEHKQYIKSLTIGENNPMYGKKHSENFYKIKSKFYNFTYKNEKIEVFNLRKFCRDNNLDQGAMTRVNKGKQITHKGYSK